MIAVIRHFLPIFDFQTLKARSCILRIRLHIQTMPDSSAIPVRPVYDVRPAKAKTKVDGHDPSTLAAVSPAGPRKLIRPQLPPRASASRYPALLSAIAPAHSTQHRGDSAAESSHAEAFYFQKQIHSQTLMTFVLEDGEQVEGTIEWYDRNAIKVRRGRVRTLIYKSSIKYLYKAEENSRA
jgi:sRNA-binding regulator protein Hfq